MGTGYFANVVAPVLSSRTWSSVGGSSLPIWRIARQAIGDTEGKVAEGG